MIGSPDCSTLITGNFGCRFWAFWIQNLTNFILDYTLSPELQSLTHKLNTHIAHKADGYWCWAYPEETLDHWHTHEDGFSSRVPIDQKPQAHHA